MIHWPLSTGTRSPGAWRRHRTEPLVESVQSTSACRFGRPDSGRINLIVIQLLRILGLVGMGSRGIFQHVASLPSHEEVFQPGNLLIPAKDTTGTSVTHRHILRPWLHTGPHHRVLVWREHACSHSVCIMTTTRQWRQTAASLLLLPYRRVPMCAASTI